MAETLGEKLRLAREARGISLSEVAAQTRIASRYLEAIEDNNYKPLPGGVFNKGFIKAYAKYVGMDEQEAIDDYSRQVAVQSQDVDDDNRYRRPKVLTDDRTSSSTTSLIFAVIILVLMSGGVYFLVQWWRGALTDQSQNPPRTATTNTATNANTQPVNSAVQQPSTDQIKIE